MVVRQVLFSGRIEMNGIACDIKCLPAGGYWLRFHLGMQDLGEVGDCVLFWGED